MVVSFRHKGLKRLFEHGDASGIRPDMLHKIRTILFQLDQARTIDDMRLASFRVHPLKGAMRGFWSVTVNANWRIIFRLHGGNAEDVELIDYH